LESSRPGAGIALHEIVPGVARNRRSAASVSTSGCRADIHSKGGPHVPKNLALAAVVALGTAALIPATADAHWSGYGWYGKSYGSPYYWGGYGPRYHYGYGGFYGPRYFYWGKFGWRKPYRYY
jgi:hypothetical protein